MSDIEQVARDLLADEYEKMKSYWHEMRLRRSTPAGFEHEVAAVVAALKSPIKLPEGYVIVPVKLTEEMRRAGGIWAIFATKAWAAMLAARPKP